MSRSGKIFKKLFWWLSGSKSKEKSECEKEKEKQSQQISDILKDIIKENKVTNENILRPLIIDDLEEKEEIESHIISEKDKSTPPPGIKVFPPISGKSNEDLEERKIYLETFNSIFSMLYVLDQRKNNQIMIGEHSSDNSNFDFTGTYSYEEAKKLYRNGYTKILGEVKKKVKKLVIHYTLDNSSRSNVVNEEVGFIPNVPNALMNLPTSMIHRKPCQRKTRVIKIMYFMEGSKWVDKDVFKKVGITLLAAIEIIEKQRISVKLDVGCYIGSSYIEVTGCVARLKNYNERVNIQKLCFPLAHPSFFRRFGFKFIETFPLLTDIYYKHSYGNEMSLDQIKKCYTFESNTIILTTLFIYETLNNNIEELINYIKKECQIS